MKKEQILGLLRESLMAGGALTFAGFSGLPSVVGIIMMIVSIIWGVWYNEGAEIIYTAIRKLLSAAPGAMVELGLINMEQATNLIAFLLPVSAMIWSYISKGDKNISNRVFAIGFFLAIAFFLPSCGGLAITPDGCVLGTYTKNGQTYKAGPCVGETIDEDGRNQIERFRVQWDNTEGQTLQATYWVKKGKPVEIQYQSANGIWLKWDSKSGVLIGPVPPEVDAALSGNPEPVEIKTPIMILAE